ncbi:MAG TPA: hypothetical protein VNF29_05025 [Candidatus Binataceae bacterium]|nr:hypothetical protein [Candidatus Binataceae bacterium]HVA80266.1 hypothetical protein [Candidatus Binataceae bacterium]
MMCAHKEIDLDVGSARLDDGSLGLILTVRCRDCRVDLYFNPTDLAVNADQLELRLKVWPYRIDAPVFASAETPEELNYRSRN